MEITKVVKPFIKRGWLNPFGNIVYKREESEAYHFKKALRLIILKNMSIIWAVKLFKLLFYSHFRYVMTTKLYNCI